MGVIVLFLIWINIMFIKNGYISYYMKKNNIGKSGKGGKGEKEYIVGSYIYCFYRWVDGVEKLEKIKIK